MTELRKRYLQDLRLRNYAPKTLQAYVECVSLFARYFKRSPEHLGPQHIREYQLYLVDEKKCSWSRFNQTVCALRFLYRNTLANIVYATASLGAGVLASRVAALATPDGALVIRRFAGYTYE